MTALKEVLWTFQVKDAANQDLALIGCHHNVKNVQQDVLIAHFNLPLYQHANLVCKDSLIHKTVLVFLQRKLVVLDSDKH